MAPSHAQLRVILIQARNDTEIEFQEQQCFLERCRLNSHQLDCLNLPKLTDLPNLDAVLKDYDALFIGGAGEFSAVENYPWMTFALELVREAYQRRLPTFGSCWGHQLIARALGGIVEHDSDKAEIGCHHVELTDAARKDVLFGAFPPSFWVNMGHHDRVVALPEGAIEMANNASQPFEAFRMTDRPMYGTQFHSELDASSIHARLIQYRERYAAQIPSPEAFDRILEGLRTTSEVDHLMFDFLTKFAVVGGTSDENLDAS